MTIHKVDPNNLPDCEVLAFNINEYILVGYLRPYHCVIMGTDTIECGGLENETMDECTHYIHSSDLVNLFKSAQDGNPKD